MLDLKPSCLCGMVSEASTRGASERVHDVQVTMSHEGLPGLYRGLAPHVLRVMPQSAITFLVYEHVLQLLRSVVPAAEPTPSNALIEP